MCITIRRALILFSATLALVAGQASVAGTANIGGTAECKTTVGTTKVCNITIGTTTSVVLADPFYSLSGPHASEVKLGGPLGSLRLCSPGITLTAGNNCFITYEFTPQEAGSRTATFTVRVTSGHTGSSWALPLVAEPATVTYSWEEGTFGACVGGTGSWQSSSWTPSEGCGPTLQSRSSVCVVDTDSGLQTRTVVCKSSDGATVADSFCTGPKPEIHQACTPASTVCGPAPEDNREVVLDNACSSRCVPDAANNRFCLMLPF